MVLSDITSEIHIIIIHILAQPFFLKVFSSYAYNVGLVYPCQGYRAKQANASLDDQGDEMLPTLLAFLLVSMDGFPSQKASNVEF